MNLVQIQERLKDMPLQAVMMYANGMNPEVPPYLALGELNRRKKMEQSMQPAQMPQGTVKEKIEQEVGLAALQKQLVDQLRTQGLRQQQTMMNQGQQMARMPGPAPQGVPQPAVPEEVEMASGGVATLMVPDNQFNFGSGGIIAFAKGSPGTMTSELDIDPYGGEPPEPSERQKRRALIDEAARLRAEELKDQKERREQAEREAARNEFLDRAGVPLSVRHSPAQGMLVFNPTEEGGMPAPRTEQRPGPPAKAPQTFPVRAPSVQPAPVQTPVQTPVQAPQGIATIPYPPAGPAQQALASLATAPQLPYPDREAMRKAAEEKDQYLKIRPGEKLEQYLTSLERRDREDQARFEKMEKDRARSALFKSLMAAGEASRGQKGIGALLGGFGRTAEAELEAARSREERQRDLMREREMNRVKMAQEIENARIAQSEGRFKDAIDHERKAAEYNQKNKEINVQIATTGAQIESTIQGRQFEINAANARTFAELKARADEGKLDRENRLLVAKIQAAAGDRPGETERLFAEYQRRKNLDPTGKLADDFITDIERLKGAPKAGSLEQQRIMSQIKPKQEELEKLTSTLGPLADKNARVQQLRKEIDALINQVGGGTSSAPKGSAKNPIILPP